MTLQIFIRKYLWFIALLGIAIYLSLFHFSTGTINPSNKKFAVVDTSKITRITIGNDSMSVSLYRTDREWMLNNSSLVRGDAIKALMNVLTRIEVGSPLPRLVRDSLTAMVALNGTKVEVYEGGKVVKSYSILSANALNLGTIGKLNSSRIVFTLQIPGFKGDIASLFVLEPDYWKSNRLFIADINQIARIDVEIPNNPEKSFSVLLDEKGIHLKATYYDRNIERFDTVSVANFIMGLSGLTFETLLSKSSLEERAAIVLSQPEQIFTITLTNNKRLVLKTFPIPVDGYRDEFGRTVKFDLNRLYISFNNDAILAIATYMVFDPVLKDISSFGIKN